MTFPSIATVKTVKNMIVDWIKRKNAAIKQAKKLKRQALTQEQEKAIDEFNSTYFADVKFPIVILSEDDYTAVSGLAEYYFDSDIQRYIGPSSELLDSVDSKYNVKPDFETGRWVPNEKTGTMNCEELKRRLAPLLYMPKHKKEIGAKKNIREVIDLLFET